MESSNIVKVVAAFVAGIVVALGSALIYVRVSDMRHAVPVSLASTSAPVVPAELPEPALDITAQEASPAPVLPEPKPAASVARPRIVPKSPMQPRRTYVNATPVNATPVKAAAKAVRKPLLLAKNDPHPVLRMPAPTPSPASDPPPAQNTAEDVQPMAQDQTTSDQATSNNVPEVTPPPPVPAAPQPHVVTIPAGTVLSIRLGETLSTDHNYTGDAFRATLMTPVIQDGFIIADRGSKVLGRVVYAQSAGHMSNVAGLSLAVTEINTTDGQRVAVRTTVYDQKGSSNVGQDTAKIAGGAALGAIIGGVAGGGKGAAIGAGVGGAAGTGAVLMTHGSAAVIGNETQLTFRLANALTITEKLN